MPKCRENRKLRFKRRAKQEARLKRKRSPPLQWHQIVSCVLADLGRASYADLAEFFDESPVLLHLLNRHNVVLSKGEIPTPGLAYSRFVFSNHAGMSPARVVDNIRQGRCYSLIEVATMIEADYLHLFFPQELATINLVILRGEWLNERIIRSTPTTATVELSAVYGFQRKPDAEADGVPQAGTEGPGRERQIPA